MTRLVCVCMVLGVLAAAGPVRAQQGQDESPELIPDETALHWYVDRFAGNSTAGPVLLQGPAREVGGMTRCAVAPAPDGSVFLATGGTEEQMSALASDGQGRLLCVYERHEPDGRVLVNGRILWTR